MKLEESPVPYAWNQNLRVLFQTQFSLLDQQLQFFSGKERREDKEITNERRETPIAIKLRQHHHHRYQDAA